jgi:hypothetical protein
MNKMPGMTGWSAIVAASLALAVTACGSSGTPAPKKTPSTPVAAVPANPFASWSAPCQDVATDLQSAGYTYATSGTSINWSLPETDSRTATRTATSPRGSGLAALGVVSPCASRPDMGHHPADPVPVGPSRATTSVRQRPADPQVGPLARCDSLRGDR